MIYKSKFVEVVKNNYIYKGVDLKHPSSIDTDTGKVENAIEAMYNSASQIIIGLENMASIDTAIHFDKKIFENDKKNIKNYINKLSRYIKDIPDEINVDMS